MEYENKHGFVPLGIYNVTEKLWVGGTHRFTNLRYIGTSEKLDHSGWFHRFELPHCNEAVRINDRDIVMVTKVGHVDLLRRESDKEFLANYDSAKTLGQTWWAKLPGEFALTRVKIMHIDKLIVQLKCTINSKIDLYTFKVNDVEFVKLLIDCKLNDVNDHINNISYQLYNNKGKLENEISE